MKIVNCSDITNPDWRFLEGKVGKGQEWKFFSSSPKNWLERLITSPKLSRLRACFESVQYAKEKKAQVLITHLPLTTWWCGEFAGNAFPAKQLAFAFNFTTLPQGLRRYRMAKAFQRIDRFVVFSNFERKLYSAYFDIPINKIMMTHWAVQPPIPAFLPPTLPRNYICAIGSNSRDYPLLMKAMEALPHISLVLVTSLEACRNLHIPPNVKVLSNLPIQEVWNVIQHSQFMVLPLQHAEVPCGHVTLVNSLFLKKPVIITASVGIEDYIQDGFNGVTVPPGDRKAFIEAISKLWETPSLLQALGENGVSFAQTHCTEAAMCKFLEKQINDLTTP